MTPTRTALKTTDAELLVACQKGDSDAFLELYERYLDMVFGFLYAYTGDKESCKKLTQDVWLACLRRIGTLRLVRGSLSSALLRLAYKTLQTPRVVALTGCEDMLVRVQALSAHEQLAAVCRGLDGGKEDTLEEIDAMTIRLIAQVGHILDLTARESREVIRSALQAMSRVTP